MAFQGQRANVFLGLSALRALDLSDGDNGGPFGELGFGVIPRLDALVAFSWFASEEHADWGAGLGLRYRLGG